MIKALIMAADSAMPEYLIDKRELFPTLGHMVETGASGGYSAYVQKGYNGSYSTEQNWSSIYTGLAPSEHGITTNKLPEMRSFDDLLPFWQVLNQSGLTVGIWAAHCLKSPIPISGYVVSCKYETIDTPDENRISPRILQFSEPWLHGYFDKEPPPRLYPKTLAQQGYTFETLKHNRELAEEAVAKYHYQDSLTNFEEELQYWFDSIVRVQSKHPVDVLYLYTPSTDLIAHCCMCSDDNDVLIEAYKLLDKYLGKLIEQLSPEMTVFLSDHGQQNFRDLIKCSDESVSREAFTARDDVIWLKNGYIAFEAHNGALLFTAHALKGTFIASGSGIRHTMINEMRSIDIYPTLLEIFGARIPPGRKGYVADIFDRPVVNGDKLFNKSAIVRKNIALIQTHSMNLMDIFINELYIENRFSHITIVGEPKYEEIFCNNPRVSGFMPIEVYNYQYYDEVYCGFYNETTKYMRHIRVK